MYTCDSIHDISCISSFKSDDTENTGLRISLAKNAGDKTWLSDILELYSDSLATESYITGQGFKNLGSFQCNAVKFWVWIFWLWNVMFAVRLLEIYRHKSDTTSSPTFATWHYQLHWVHPHYVLVHLLHQPMHLPGSLRPCRKSLIHQKKVDQHEMYFERSRHHQPLRRGDWLWHWLMLQSTGNTWRGSAGVFSRHSAWLAIIHSYHGKKEDNVPGFRNKKTPRSAEKTCYLVEMMFAPFFSGETAGTGRCLEFLDFNQTLGLQHRRTNSWWMPGGWTRKP